MEETINHSKHITTAIVICGLASLFYVYDYFIQVAPSVMTHDLMRAFNIGAAELGILGACFYYSYTLMQIPAGILLDRYGARRLLSFAVLMSAVGVLIFAIAGHFAIAGLGRFLIGFGSSFAFISALFLVSRWFAHKHFALMAGFIQFAGCLGSIFGLGPMAYAVNHFGWRQSMLYAALITFLFAILFWLVIRDGEQPIQQIATDKNGLAKEWQRIKLLLKNSQVWWVALCGLVSWVPVAVVGALWGVPYLMRVYHISNVVAGNLVALFWVGLAIGSPFVGWCSDRIQLRRVPIIICFSVGFIAGILLLFAASLPLWFVSVALLMLGFSASVQALSFGVIKDVVPAELFATASGINNMAAILGGAISQPLVGFLIRLNWSGIKQGGLPVYSIADYRVALLVLPTASVIGILVASSRLKETHCQQHAIN